MTSPDLRKLIHARRKSRRLAMQALYQWQLTDQHPKDILAQFQADDEMASADPDYFRELLLEVTERHAALDARVEPFIDRKSMAEVDPVERAILRIAVYELEHRLDVPYRVVVNEAIELTKKFGAEQAHRFVNGVLDKLAQELRKAEVSISR
ncbi:MAG TPA: transcription antitermination factor NusB [Thioalkalivibrio sp.]|nr:transcription antitermination factor NusB [Thioalkalivibrio sp.]